MSSIIGALKSFLKEEPVIAAAIPSVVALAAAFGFTISNEWVDYAVKGLATAASVAAFIVARFSVTPTPGGPIVAGDRLG